MILLQYPRKFPGYNQNQYPEWRWQLAVWFLTVGCLLNAIPICVYWALSEKNSVSHAIFPGIVFFIFGLLLFLLIKFQILSAVKKGMIDYKNMYRDKKFFNPFAEMLGRQYIWGKMLFPCMILLLTPIMPAADFVRELGISASWLLIWVLPNFAIVWWALRPIEKLFL